MIHSLCMECHNEPEEFENDKGQKAYWMVVMPDDYSPVVLMSSLEYKFVVGTEKIYEAEPGETFICIKCFENIYGEFEDDE